MDLLRLTHTLIYLYVLGRWHDVILTPAPRAASEPLSHIMSFTLKALLPGSVYEAIVQAKNRYGWNEVSISL